MNTQPGTILLLQETRRQLAEAEKDRTAYANRIKELTSERDDLERRLHRFVHVHIITNRQTQALEFCTRVPDCVAKDLGREGTFSAVIDEMHAQLLQRLRCL